MAFFTPPAAPEGYEYVVRDQNYVLVPKSELTEDICPATGRTWAEEARLYNIRNAPDGKKIAEPGDQFYRTAEDMKRQGKAINNISAGTLKYFAQLSGTSAGAPPPSLADTIDKIKSGAVNADIGSALSKMTEVSGSLPANVSTDLAAAQADIAAKLSAAQANLPKLTAIAQANMDLATKLAASQGRAPTEAELKAASGALAIFQDGPALLKSKAEAIGKEIATAGEAFGAAIPKAIKDAGGAISAGLDKITDAAKAAGTAISNAISGVPTPTIPDPLNPGQTITNPAYTTYAANPANAATVASFQNVLGKVQTLATDLSSKFGEIETKQSTAVAGGVTDLKAFAFAAQLAQPATGILGQAKSLSVDPASFDAASITKAISFASKLGPSIDTAIFKNTKDEDLTYKGDDGIVWDRTNAERERRGLPGLAAIGSPRPKDPPLVPAGSTPPKPPESVIKAAKPVDVEAPATKAPKKRAVFDKDPDEPIFNPFVRQYYNVFKVYDDALNLAVSTLSDDVVKWMDIGKDYEKLRAAGNKILEEKPDASTRTEEEKAIVKERSFYTKILKQYSDVFRKYNYALERRNELNQQYGVLREAFMASKTFGDLPLSVETAVMKDSGPVAWKTSSDTPYYKSFSEFAKANPDQATYTA